MSMFEKIARNLAIGMMTLFSFSLLDATEVLTEAKIAYFHPTDSRFQEIYSGGALYSIEASVQTCYQQLYPWASIGYFHKSQFSVVKCPDTTCEGESTRITVVPIGLGLKYLFPIECMYPCPYLGAGILLSFVRIHNDYSFVSQNLFDWGIGGIIKGGFLLNITDCVFFDLFLDYSYMKVGFRDRHQNISNSRADLSGLTIGGGVAYRF